MLLRERENPELVKCLRVIRWLAERDGTPSRHGPPLDIRKELEKQLMTPMRHVCAAIKGSTEIEKARNAGVSRMQWWRWRNGQRPSWPQALRLAKLTGIPAARIANQ